MCLDRASGDLLWQKGVVYTEEESTHETNPYCSPSPATDGERVIVWHGSAGLHCYGMDGAEIWSRDLGKQEHMWGYGSSPIIYGDLCILNFGPGMREFLVAVDKRTGEPVWKVDSLSLDEESALSGPENNGRVDVTRYDEETTLATMLRGSWTTPVVRNIDGRDEMILTQARRVSAYDPKSGEILWVCGGLAPLAYTSPVIGNNLIVAMGGYHGGSLAVRPGGDGNVTDTHRVWHAKDGPNWLSTGIIHEGYAYFAGIEGILLCYDAATGEQRWERRLPPSGGSGEVWGSMTKSGDGLVYVMNQSGDTFVFRPSPEKYDQVARNSLDEPTNSTPVISDGQLFLRTHEALWCIE
jgi:outer membrane protein assembly factor BamB